MLGKGPVRALQDGAELRQGFGIVGYTAGSELGLAAPGLWW